MLYLQSLKQVRIHARLLTVLPLFSLVPAVQAQVDPAEILRIGQNAKSILEADLTKAEGFYRQNIAGQIAGVDRVEIYQLAAPKLQPAPEEAPAEGGESFTRPVGAFATTEAAIEKKQSLDAKSLSFFRNEMTRILQVTGSPTSMPEGSPRYGLRAWCKSSLVLDCSLYEKPAKTAKDPNELLFSLSYPQLGYRVTSIQAPAAFQSLLSHLFPATPVKK